MSKSKSKNKSKRKKTLINKITDKQKKVLMILLVIEIFFVLTLFIASSYALLTNYDTIDNAINFKTGNLNVTLTSLGNPLVLTELNGKLPESDQVGLQNALPVVLTLTNTGSMFIEGYEIKLIKEENKISNLDEKYIKYSISEDDINYSEPTILTENNNIVFSGYDLDVGVSKTVYLKVWLDEFSGNNALNKQYYGSIQVELYQKKEKPEIGKDTIMDSIVDNSSDICNPIEIDTDGTIYFSGDKNCVDFNYVWYSGKMWRITAIYPDGKIKMVTDDIITSIAYGPNNVFYTNENTTSYMYQWLNQEFLSTLYNYEKIIVKNATWNASAGNGIASSKLPIENQEESIINSNVGLLNSYEYYMSSKNASAATEAYLNIGYQWMLLNPYSSTSSNLWCANFTGGTTGCSVSLMNSTRPAIILKSSVEFNQGTGIESDPYKIKDDQQPAISNVTLINTRQSGEYVNFNNELFRIVGVENDTTKLIKLDYMKENDTIMEKKFGSSSTFGTNIETGSNDYWDSYLNNTWKTSFADDYKEILTEGTYYIKSFPGGNYKESVCTTFDHKTSIKDCDKTDVSFFTGYVGTSRYGEMFASLPLGYNYNNSKKLWLITPYSVVTVWQIGNRGYGSSSTPSTLASIRPTIHLNSDVLIKSGSGTKEEPYKVV